MRTEQTTRHKRIHRDSMDKYVFEPSRDYGAAFGTIGLGVGLCIVAVFASDTSKPMAASLIIISMAAVFGGVGWAIMIKARLDAYYFDIMQERAIDETITTEHDETPIVPRRIPNGRGEVIIELEQSSGLDNADWTKLASAVLISRVTISKGALTKANAISQPKYAKFYAYMNAEGYMKQENGTNALTHDGKMFLTQYLPAQMTHSMVSGNGN